MLIRTALAAVTLLATLGACSENAASHLSEAEYQRLADESGHPIEDVKREFADYKTTENTILLHKEDEGLKAARAEAQRTLPKFLQKLRAKAPGTYSIKFPLRVSGKVEHIWLQVDRVNGAIFHGRLANKPVGAGSEYRMGQSMQVAKHNVEDWMIRVPEGIYGGYTARHAATKMPPAERAELERMLLD
ncbi:MAG: DUF2314 domain-containing protein [Pseudomonadota bacterium]